eukprot:3211225-Lingulodinium_polyedra.AAC.1
MGAKRPTASMEQARGEGRVKGRAAGRATRANSEEASSSGPRSGASMGPSNHAGCSPASGNQRDRRERATQLRAR